MCHLASISQRDEIKKKTTITVTFLDLFGRDRLSTTHLQTWSSPEWAPSLCEALRLHLGCPLSAHGGWARDTLRSKTEMMAFQ